MGERHGAVTEENWPARSTNDRSAEVVVAHWVRDPTIGRAVARTPGDVFVRAPLAGFDASLAVPVIVFIASPALVPIILAPL